MSTPHRPAAPARPRRVLAALAIGWIGVFFASAAGAHGPGTGPAHFQGMGPNQPSAAIEEVETALLLMMTHLDVGYTGFAIDVINVYFESFFPAAINYAAEVAQSPDPNLREVGYIFTSHPWLISLYLDCPEDLIPGLACPSEEQQESFIAAIKKGVITWQGYTFNLQAELMDPSLFRFALDMTRELDRRFGKETITLSLRDVPGTTRAILPLMREKGFRAISIGANGAVVSAALPNAFVWRNGAGGEEVLGLLHAAGYGGIKLQDCVTVPGLKQAFCPWFTGDNQGPPNASAVAQVQRIVAKQFPKAKVRAATFDDFTRALETVRSKLPVVDLDIGDTWVGGPPADPWKLTMFREMSRARAECLAAGRCPADDPAIRNFSRLLLKAPEHTAGLSSTGELQSYSKDWSNRRFEQVRDQKEFQTVEASWTEQREFLDWALQALNQPQASAAAKALYQDISARLAALKPAVPSTQGFAAVSPEGPFTCGLVDIGFDAETGAIDRLVDRRTGRQWASPGLVAPVAETEPFRHAARIELEEQLRTKHQKLDSPLPMAPPRPFEPAGHPLALFLYRTYDALDYYFYLRQYSYVWPPVIDSLSLAAFYKPGVETAFPRSTWWLPELNGTWRREGGEGCELLLELAMQPQPHTRYGAPASAWVRVVVPPDSATVKIDLQWFDKTTTRLPEALWMAFKPVAPDSRGWRFQVLDELLSPQEVAVNGSRHLGAVWEGVSYCDDKGHLFIETLDATVVSPGLPALLDYNNQPVEPQEGMFFNFVNNVWNTNWPLYYPWIAEDADSRFRFALHLETGCDGGRRLSEIARRARR